MIKKITFFKITSYLLIIFCTINVFPQSNDCNKVVGKWITKDKKTGLEFFKDGTFEVVDLQKCTLRDLEIYITGKWICLDNTSELKLFDLSTKADEQRQANLDFLQFSLPNHIQFDNKKMIFKYEEDKTEIDLYENFLESNEESPYTSEEILKTYKDIIRLKERGYVTYYLFKKVSSFPKKKKR